jgi:undecaprenyl-diphosphatase
MPIWQAVVLGVIQGITEFLPISSTAHLVVARDLLGHKDSSDSFTVVIQFGTLAAVFIYFRADVAHMLGGLWADIRARRLASTPDSRLGWLIVLGTVPAVVCGVLFEAKLKTQFFNAQSIAVVAIVYALLLGAAEWWAHRRVRLGRVPREVPGITWLDALWIGTWQACALMPGGSRSGTTLTGGLFAGLARPAAARFSFLLSLPIVLGAGLKAIYDDYKKLHADEITALVVGTLVSFVVGYLAIAFLLNFLRRYSTVVFVVYRVLFGVALLALVAWGYLPKS